MGTGQTRASAAAQIDVSAKAHVRKEMYLNHKVTCHILSNVLDNKECTIEEDTSYAGNDLNDGLEDPKQDDAESCRSFCKSDYPSAKYFTWVGPDVTWQRGRNACWCKDSDSGRMDGRGKTSGAVTCGNQGDKIITTTTTATTATSHSGEYLWSHETIKDKMSYAN